MSEPTGPSAGEPAGAPGDEPLRVRAGGALFRWRGLTPVPLLAAGLALGRPSLATVACGAAIAVTGEVIRAWSVAHIGAVSRTRGGGVGPLVVGGPYARSRNPIYVGNLLLGGGVAWGVGVPALPALYALLFLVQYGCIVAWEETRLAAAHGDAYRSYCRVVPRWFPLPGRRWELSAPARRSPREVLRAERGTLLTQGIAWAAVIAVGVARGTLAW